MDILSLLKKSEGKTLEFKRNLSSPTNILRTMVAFANTAGGTILIGVEDKTKHVCGIEDPLLAEEKLTSLISDHITPQLLPEIVVIPWRNTYLVSIQIFPSSAKPHYLKQKGLEKGTYIRVGSSNRMVDRLMLVELSRVKLEDSFDKQLMPELSSEAINFTVASDLFSNIKKLRKKDLISLGVLAMHQQREVPTFGGMILFGKERLTFFPDAWIQAGRFRGLTKSHITDTQEITTHPIAAIEEAIDFIKKHAMQGIDIKGAQHTKTWSLPLTAVREAIINAVVHADYSQQGSPIRLAIFDDRIEIENPGLLLFGLTIEEVKQGVSKLRNRVIGHIFYRLGLIERWGSGIARIIDSCSESGFSEPLFEEIGTHFRVTIFTEVTKKPALDTTDNAIITTIRNSNGLSTKEIANAIHKSIRATRTRLIRLIETGLVVEVSRGPNDPGKKYLIRN